MCEINMPALAANALMNASQSQATTKARPLIDYINLQFWYCYDGDVLNNKTKRPDIKMTRSIIKFGCTDITPRALRELLETYEKHFNTENKEITIQ